MGAASSLVGGLRRQDWAFFALMFCTGGVITSFAIGDRIAPVVWGLGAIGAGTLARRWSRMYPAPMPHTLRFFLYLSHPGLSPQALHHVLALRPGERLLEIGPGSPTMRCRLRRRSAQVAVSMSSTSSPRCSGTSPAAPSNAD